VAFSLPQRSVRRSETAAEQLQAALNSRVVIEQAKGKLAERLSVDMDRAFRLQRDYARNNNLRLAAISAVRAALPADKAFGLGAKLARATQAGPTRPHPHTPPSPAVLKAAGPAVAAVDRLRDAASARDN
jgi:hypothetical protein